MLKEPLRKYEVSIWTLQDSFIAVLKPFNLELKGQIQDPDMSIKDDGTETFKFSIPMYLYQKEEDISIRQQNPLWANVANGVLLANMRKIKVIFDKHGENEKVYEFIILKVTDRHENDQLFCDVECEGLAFHELGKIGYKLSLTGEDFEEEYKIWAESQEGNEPVATLNYWNDKIFKDGDNWKYKWEYEIQMKHILGTGLGYDPGKVYEESYVSSWKTVEGSDKLAAAAVENYKEKARTTFDLKESNIYNITQKLAEAFGVFCRYEYEHDSNYHIIGKKVIYYDNFIAEDMGILDITYPYDTSEITREMDSTDNITKMYVQSVDDDTTAEGQITIMDVEANKMKEDYLLNFDYLHTTGAITDAQYDEIGIYEKQMYVLNNTINDLNIKIKNWERQLPELEAKKTVLEESVRLDDEKYNEADDFIRTLTSGTGIMEHKGASCDKVVVVEDINPSVATHQYYATLKEKGIIESSIKVYSKQDYTNKGAFKNEDEITNFQVECNEFGSATKIYLLSSELVNSLVYIEYNYEPESEYEKLKELYARKKKKDKEELDAIVLKISNFQSLIDKNKNGYKDENEVYHFGYYDYINQKEKIIYEFENMMGPALREGYWTPEDYTDYGDKYNNNININYNQSIIYSQTSLMDFIWDSYKIDNDKQNDNYELGLEQTIVKYPCIVLTQAMYEKISSHLSDLSLSFFDYDTENDSRRVSFVINSQLKFCFMKKNDTIIPALMVLGAVNLSTESIEKMINTAQLGFFTTTESIGNIIDTNQQYTQYEITFTPLINNALTWVNIDSTDAETYGYNIVYPRIEIQSLKLKNTPSELTLHYKNVLLDTVKDYYTFTNQINENAPWYYYITIKPEVFFINGFSNPSITINYAISNANIAIYLDAIQVLKENSQPKVSYTVKINAVNKKQYLNEVNSIIGNLYQLLNCIANINDTDLKFQNVQGYISEINLKLDKPQDDEIVIQNYKTKFEDLFSNIVAQTESMQKNSYVFGMISNAFSPSTGNLTNGVLQQSIERADLNLSFNSGTLSIDNQNGIWAVSDRGAVAMSGGGIFTATEKDASGNWKWNTGILPSGINASLITAGQLDTNKIRIFSGDQLRFQWNGDGLFAYKSFSEDLDKNLLLTQSQLDMLNAANTIISTVDLKQYVKLDENGLALIAESGAYIPVRQKDEHNNYVLDNNDEYIYVYDNTIIPENTSVKRVEISWDGFKLRDWNNQEVFYADPDTGDLYLAGHLKAYSLTIGVDIVDDNTQQISTEYVPLVQYINDTARVNGALLNVDPDQGKINLYAWKKDGNGQYIVDNNNLPVADETNNGDKISSVLISYDGIDLYSGSHINLTSGSINLNGTGNISLVSGNSNISLTGQGINLEGGSISLNSASSLDFTNGNNYVRINSNGLSLNGEAINVTGGELVFTNTSGNTLSMSTNGISLSSGDFLINGYKVWGKNNIIVSIDEVPSGQHPDHDWVWIKPQSNAAFNAWTNPASTKWNVSGGKKITFTVTRSQSFGTASWYQYDITFTIQRTGSNSAITTNASCRLYDSAGSVTFNTNSFWTGNDNAKSVSGSSGHVSPNVVSSQRTTYLEVWLSEPTGEFTISNITLTCSSDTVSGRAPCDVFYYS